MLVIDQSEQAQARFNEIMQFAAKHDLLGQLIDTLHHLSNYANAEGCMYDKEKGKNTCCTLYPDWAPLSMRIRMEYTEDWDGTAGIWKCLYTGGLVYQGPDQPADGSGPSFTVSLNSEKVGWYVHT